MSLSEEKKSSDLEDCEGRRGEGTRLLYMTRNDLLEDESKGPNMIIDSIVPPELGTES